MRCCDYINFNDFQYVCKPVHLFSLIFRCGAKKRIPMSAITTRHLNIDLSKGFALQWLGGDAFRTQFFNALSMSFPIGEQCFIDSVRAALPLLTDAALYEQAQGFIGQEATHRHMHKQYNRDLGHQGLHFVLKRMVAWRVRNLETFDVKDRMAVTAAYEHFTAILSDSILRCPPWFEDAQEPLKTLWCWHAIEETEHKSVAFDVYHATGGGYWRRVLWFAYIAMLFATDTAIQTAHNLHQGGHLFEWATWRSAFKFLWGRQGLVRLLAGPMLAYFRKDFLPWHYDNRALMETWLDQHATMFREIGHGRAA
jgi:predicted metal-dependent hydrolase